MCSRNSFWLLYLSVLITSYRQALVEALDPCPEGWDDVRDLGLGCLYFEFQGMTFHAANKFCYERNSHMVELDLKIQMDYIVTRLQVLIKHPQY